MCIFTVLHSWCAKRQQRITNLNVNTHLHCGKCTVTVRNKLDPQVRPRVPSIARKSVSGEGGESRELDHGRE